MSLKITCMANVEPAPAISSLAVERSQRRHIEQCRELLKPAPVELNRTPNWLQLRLLKRFRTPLGFQAGRDVLSNALWRMGLSDCPFSLHPWFDHVGRSESRGGQILVSEPYCISIVDFAAATEFARQAGLRLVLSANSHGCPSHTLRMEFHDAEGPCDEDN